jgi:hypothetical protein
MSPGAQVTGRLTEAGTGAAVTDVEVCALDRAPTPRAEEFERCTQSDEAGSYVIRSLTAETYIVVFAPHRPLGEEVIYEQQHYAGATDRRAASPISIAPPQTVYGIDVSLVSSLRPKLVLVSGFRTVTTRAWARIGFRFSSGS